MMPQPENSTGEPRPLTGQTAWVTGSDLDPRRMVAGGTLVRYGHPDEVARVVGFLCSPATGFLSGQIIRVDGGEQTFPV
jgi:3-oxoacyl-[acyl-carrier protein] reductase